jgi:benzoyl-CoA reductase subunit C
MKHLKHFEEMASVLNNPEIQAWKKAGRRLVGTQCSNIPEEVLYAAGLLPVRLRAPGLEDYPNADAHLHRINCSYSRAVLELMLRGDLNFLDGLVTTNTCDHHLRLAGELEENSDFRFLHYLQMHHTINEGARQWLVSEMKNMIRHIEETFNSRITEKALRNAVSVYNRTRSLMARLNEMRRRDPPPISGSEYMNIVLAGMSTPREWFNERLESLMPDLEERPVEGAGKPRLMVIGGACDSPGFIDFIEKKGAWVVADGMCFGLRHYMGQIDEDAKNPLQAIADRYFGRMACPSSMDSFDHNYPIFKKIIDDLGVQGIVSARIKFCDHWAGARQLLRDELQKEDIGVPMLDLEREYSTTGSGQISTRVQAYLEMLTG